MATNEATLVLDHRFAVGDVPARLFGSFVEQAGRGVYNGLYEPDHPHADENGFRRDVLDLVRELGVTTVRYPGGNYVSGHRWEDGTGPRHLRPRRLELAWHGVEPNTFGLDEFALWARTAGVEPMLAVNLGTRGVLEALDMLEYCNGTAGTFQADRRRANGKAEPFDVRIWCLGNEPDGPWQLGHTDALHYGRLARQTASGMHMMDPDLELVVAGSSGTDMPTYGSWERIVLEETYDDVDFISAHQYYFEKGDDLSGYLSAAVDFDSYLHSVISTIDHVKSVRRSSHRVDVSVDEWGVWYQLDHGHEVVNGEWPVGGPRLEDRYSAADAVVYGSMLISLLKRVDRVRAASAAQLVNVIAPIMTEDRGRAWRQTIFHPFAAVSSTIGSMVLRPALASTTLVTDRFGEVPSVDAVGLFDEDAGTATVFAVHRDTAAPAEFTIDASTLGVVAAASATTLTDVDPRRKGLGSPSDPSPAHVPVSVEGSRIVVELPAASWNVIRIELGASA